MDARHAKHHQLILGSLSLLFYLYTILPAVANENVMQLLEKDLQRVVAKVRPAVVKVVATQVMEIPLSSESERVVFMQQNIGSGIVIDRLGHVVTTSFEEEPPEKIEVIFSDKKAFDATLIGMDAISEIAVLRIADPVPGSVTSPLTSAETAPHGVPPQTWGDSSHIDTGSWVLTIGSTYGQSPIVSFGIVGGWDYLPNLLCTELIKINAAVTPGNSGGAVVNSSGEVIGMILAVLAEPGGPDPRKDFSFQMGEDGEEIAGFRLNASPLLARHQEITFAIPIETVRAIAEDIITHGKVARGWLGVEVDISELGVFVTGVIEGSPAHRSGLLPEDIILEFNEVPVHSYAELLRCVVSKQPATEVQLKLGRNGAEEYCTVILGEKR